MKHDLLVMASLLRNLCAYAFIIVEKGTQEKPRLLMLHTILKHVCIIIPT